uniref:Shugoshin C-terminal domain-containing protein n=1 Tax=Oryza brachyantha TaxID=4533 RepID=J3LI20_ORYBR
MPVFSSSLQELNQGKDRLKLLQHELACTTAVLKAKDSELEGKKFKPSKRAQAEARQKAAAAVPSYTNCQEPTQDKTTKRHTNKRKSESCEVTKDANTVQHSCRPHKQSSGSLHDDDPRKTLRRRSARLNPASFEITEVSCDTFHEDATVPLFHSSSNVPNQQEPNAGKDMRTSLQNELLCDAIAQVEAPELKKNERNMHMQKEVHLEEEMQEAGSRVAGVEADKFDIEDSKPPQDRGTKRKSMRIDANKRKLESCEDRMASNKEDCKPLQHEEKRTRRKSSRLDSGPCEVSNETSEIVQEDKVAPSAHPSSKVLIEQTKNDMQNGCSSSTNPSEELVIGRRSSVGRPSRRAAEKIVSYREVPLNVKMRRS